MRPPAKPPSVPAHTHEYAVLDVDLERDEDGHAIARASTAWAPVDAQPASAEAQHRTRRRQLLGAGVVCAVGTVLILAAVLTTRPGSIDLGMPVVRGNASLPAAAAGAADAGDGTSGLHEGVPASGVWHEGSEFAGAPGVAEARPPGYRPCRGSSLACGVVNKQPRPEADFRGLPRRAAASHGVVAADCSRCSQVGRDVLAEGGNAVDAAVAVALCQGVVNPVSSGLGGGAFITVRLANGSAAFIDARETAPAAASAGMYDGLPRMASVDGALAVAVPGELTGLGEAFRRFGSGKLPWARLVAPAAKLAASGFAAHPYLVHIMSGPSNLRRMQSLPGLRDAFLIPTPGGGWRLPVVGERCCARPAFAATLDAIAQQGPGYLASPPLAAAMAAELAAAGGILAASDFEGAAPVVRPPLVAQLGDLELLLPPPPSSAAVVGFCLKFLASYGGTALPRLSASLAAAAGGSAAASSSSSSRSSQAAAGEPVSASFGGAAPRDGGLGLHRLVECSKHAFAVRTALGDPGPPRAPFPGAARIHAAAADLLSDAFVADMRRLTNDSGVLPDEAYGGRWNPLGVAPPEEHGTSHWSVVDAQRNAVAVTSSINTPFGSGLVSNSTGILWGNTMDDFAIRPSIVTPHPSAANAIAPGRRPLSAMSPIIVAHKPSGLLVATAGASGGPLIVSATLQTLARLLLEGADVADAVAQPRVHDQLLPTDATFYEAYAWGHTAFELPSQQVGGLQARGQSTRASSNFSLGVSQAIWVDYGSSSGSGSSSSPGQQGGTAGAVPGGSSGGASGGGVVTEAGRTGRGGGSAPAGVLLGFGDPRKDGAAVGY